MLVTFLAALAVAGPAPQKTTLDNGVMVYAERMDSAPGFTVHLFVSTWGAQEPEGQRGWRHLIEHLVAKGRNKDLAAKLEAQGLTLSADTLPDGVRFEIEGSAGKEAQAIQALRDLLAFPALTQEDVAREARIMEQESAVRSSSAKIAAGLRKQAFAAQSDLMGDAADIAKATPAALAELYAGMFRPESMSVAVIGDVNAMKAVEAVTSALGTLPKQGRPDRTPLNALPQAQEGFVQGASGAGRAVVVESTGRSDTLAVIAAGLAIASEVPGARLVYTPSPHGGVVCLTHPSRTGFEDLDRLITREDARLLPTALVSVRLWADTAGSLTRDKARLYGQMLGLEPFFRMEDLRTRAYEVDHAAARNALQKFHTSKCVRVGGSR